MKTDNSTTTEDRGPRSAGTRASIVRTDRGLSTASSAETPPMTLVTLSIGAAKTVSITYDSASVHRRRNNLIANAVFGRALTATDE